jgi:hypothetical protein
MGASAIAVPAMAQTQSVVSFTLINADTNTPVPGYDPLPNGATLNLATLPTRRLNIRANTSPSIVGSVRFGYDSNANYRTENGNPYSLAGDNSGDYAAWTPSLGSHTVTATPYTLSSAGGTRGTAKTQSFAVVDVATSPSSPSSPAPTPSGSGKTRVTIAGSRFYLNGAVTYPGAQAEGLLMNARMVNAVFEDTNKPSFDPEANTDEFLAALPEYVGAGMRAFTISLQGGNPSYEGAVNTAFTSSGALRSTYMARVKRVIEAADAHGAVIILTLFYQRQDEYLADETAVKNAVVNVAKWVTQQGFTNVLLEIANEYTHTGFEHAIIRTSSGMVTLIKLAKQTAPGLYVSTSGYGDGYLDSAVAAASDYLLIHMNSVGVSGYRDRITRLTGLGKPILISEDPKEGSTGASAAATAVQYGASWGLFLRENQAFPFSFAGVADDPVVYDEIRELTASGGTPPPATPPESGAPSPIRVNAGGPDYLDQNSQLWVADAYYSGGRLSVGTTAPIANTVDDPLYQRMRYGNLSYRFPVPAGTYQVTLQFAEIYWSAAGKRVFDARVEGQLAADNLDVWARVGKNAALAVTITVPVSDGVLDVDLLSVVDNAMISAIEVLPVTQ